MKSTLLFSMIAVLSLTAKSQVNIAAARTATLNSTVNVKGVVLNGPEMGVIRYLQDNSGGIAAYSSSLSALNRGDSVQINGPLTEYRNLFEIASSTVNLTPVTFTVLGTGSAQTPSVITSVQFGENVEGRLIKFIGCAFSATGTFSNNTNYTVTTSAGNFIARVTSSVSSLFGSPIPTGSVDIVGIGSQFCTTPSSGCTTGYQLALRDLNDITASSIGINEVKGDFTNIYVYPNPANNKLNFKLTNEQTKSVTITDNLGREVLLVKENINYVDISRLNSGIYYILITTDKSNYRSKFTVEK